MKDSDPIERRQILKWLIELGMCLKYVKALGIEHGQLSVNCLFLNEKDHLIIDGWEKLSNWDRIKFKEGKNNWSLAFKPQPNKEVPISDIEGFIRIWYVDLYNPSK